MHHPLVTGITLHWYTKNRTTLPLLMALLLLLPAGDLGADPVASGAESSGTRKAGKKRAVKKARKRRARKARKRRVRGSRRKRARKARKRRARKRLAAAGTRCRDIFCTSRVLALEGKGSSFKQLSSTQVQRVMLGSVGRLEPCLVLERRKDPHLKGVTIEFVVSRGGKVLATRIDQRDRVGLSRCMRRAMKRVRFPRVTGRTVATFTVNVPR